MPNLLLLIPTPFWYKNQYLVSMLEARCGSRLRESLSCGGHPGRHCDWRAPSAMWESSHRAETPRPAGPGGTRQAGLGTTTARGLNLSGSIFR